MGLRAAQSGVTMSLGMVQMVGNLYTPEETESKKAGKFKNCCKICYDKDGTVSTLKNRSYCEVHEDLVESDDVIKGKEEDDKSVTIVGTTEEVKEAKATSTLVPKVMDLVVHKADEVDAAMFAGDGASYVFLPSNAADFYHVLMAVMDEDGRILCDDGEDRVIVSNLLNRDVEHLVRLTKWNGHLVVKVMLRPEQLKEFPDVDSPEITDKNKSVARMIVAAQTEEFDPDNYRDENRERLAEWIKARSGGVTITPAPKGKKKQEMDLDDMLSQALAAAQAKAS